MVMQEMYWTEGTLNLQLKIENQISCEKAQQLFFHLHSKHKLSVGQSSDASGKGILSLSLKATLFFPTKSFYLGSSRHLSMLLNKNLINQNIPCYYVKTEITYQISLFREELGFYHLLQGSQTS